MQNPSVSCVHPSTYHQSVPCLKSLTLQLRSRNAFSIINYWLAGFQAQGYTKTIYDDKFPLPKNLIKPGAGYALRNKPGQLLETFHPARSPEMWDKMPKDLELNFQLKFLKFHF